MQNEMQYLSDTYLLNSRAKVDEVGSDEKGTYVILESTIFHPQGGGQPADKGSMVSGDYLLNVQDVRFINGRIRHYVAESDVSLASGEEVQLHVDEAIRMRNSKAHTAGHLVQAVIEEMDVGLRATKGYHFPQGSYVQFSGKKPEDVDTFRNEVNQRLPSALSQGQTTEARMVQGPEIKTMLPDLPYALPDDKPMRVIKIGQIGHYIPCGGTHLKNINELNHVEITKIKSKKGETKISYQYD